MQNRGHDARESWYCCKDIQFGRKCRTCGKKNPAARDDASYQEKRRHEEVEWLEKEEDRLRRRKKRSRRFTERLERHRLEVPDQGVDFFRKLLGKGSTFPIQIRDNTGCECWIDRDSRGGQCIILEGDEGELPDTIKKIRSLFKASSEELAKLLSRCTGEGKEAKRDEGKDSPELPACPPPPPPSSYVPDSKTCKKVPVPEQIALHLMTAEHKDLLIEQSGAEVEFDALNCCVVIQSNAASGTARENHVQTAAKLVNRVIGHCKWGSSESKVRRILKPRMLQNVEFKLSPMDLLPIFERRLTPAQPTISIGKDPSNDVFIKDDLVSRKHCILELDAERGGVFVIDTSTNGTFLNNERLPAQGSSKVLLSHGDDLVLKHPDHDPNREFGWVVNMTEIAAKGDDTVLQAPRRIINMRDLAPPRALQMT